MQSKAEALMRAGLALQVAALEWDNISKKKYAD